jgi:hypothetical protein
MGKKRYKEKPVRPDWLPLELRVGGAKYDVRFERTESDNALGECSTAETFIRVSPYTPVGRKVSEESMKSTFWHELVHVILDTMDEYELSSNEKFVSVFSSMLNEAICTSKWNDDIERPVWEDEELFGKDEDGSVPAPAPADDERGVPKHVWEEEMKRLRSEIYDLADGDPVIRAAKRSVIPVPVREEFTE